LRTIISWTETIWTKIMQCRFCNHFYGKEGEGYPSIWVGDKLAEDHLKRLIESHMRFAHKGKIVFYGGKLWHR